MSTPLVVFAHNRTILFILQRTHWYAHWLILTLTIPVLYRLIWLCMRPFFGTSPHSSNPFVATQLYVYYAPLIVQYCLPYTLWIRDHVLVLLCSFVSARSADLANAHTSLYFLLYIFFSYIFMRWHTHWISVDLFSTSLIILTTQKLTCALTFKTLNLHAQFILCQHCACIDMRPDSWDTPNAPCRRSSLFHLAALL